jgi:alpha-N-arabinofuranosidase
MKIDPFERKRCSRRTFLQGAGVVAAGALAGAFRRAHAFAGPQAAEAPLAARIFVDTERQLGKINPNLYGNFIEHLGRCIYGGMYEEGSPLSDSNGFRTDVHEAAKRLRVTNLRWPGGNFVSGYRWEDGIGPKDSRPARYDLAWFERESNRYGTHEFMESCRRIGSEPYFCVNVGNGTLDQAWHWVEYCNHPGGTYYSDLRKKNGSPEPFKVKYWGVGNEIYGSWQIGHKSAEDYAKIGLEFAKVMKWMDPTIELIAVGDGDPSWDRPVLERMGRNVDYIAAHHYTLTDPLKDYYEIVAAAAEMEQKIRVASVTAAEMSQRLRKSPPLSIAFDEWNILRNWSDGQKRDDVHKFEVDYNLRDALWTASALNALQRACRTVKLANLAQLVNVIAPMHATSTGLLLKPTYYPLEIYANRSAEIALDVAVTSPVFETKNWGAQPYLDVMGTYDEATRGVRLAVVNRRKEGDVVGTIDLAPRRAKAGGKAFVLTGPNPEAVNTFQNPDLVKTQEVKFSASGNRIEYRFPRHSLTWLEFEVEG